MSEFYLRIQKVVFCVDKHENDDVKAMSHLAAGWSDFSDNSLKCTSGKIFNLRNKILGFMNIIWGFDSIWMYAVSWDFIHETSDLIQKSRIWLNRTIIQTSPSIHEMAKEMFHGAECIWFQKCPKSCTWEFFFKDFGYPHLNNKNYLNPQI